jgi:hypothetical protein
MNLVSHAMEIGYSGLRSDIIHAFKAGSDLHGARIEGKSDLDVAGVFVEAPILNLGIDKREHFITSTADDTAKNTTDDKAAAFVVVFLYYRHRRFHPPTTSSSSRRIPASR